MEIKKNIESMKEKGCKWIVEHKEDIVRGVMFVSGISVGIFTGAVMVGYANRNKGYDFWEGIYDTIPVRTQYGHYQVDPTDANKLKHPYFFIISDEDYDNLGLREFMK